MKTHPGIGIVLCAICPAISSEVVHGQSCEPAWSDQFSSGELDFPIYGFAVFDDGGGPALYGGGIFETASGVTVNRIAKLDGNSWSVLGAGLDNSTFALRVFDDGSGASLYAGGQFQFAGEVEAARIARWDGRSWSSVDGGLHGEAAAWVQSFAEFDDGTGPALYVGGFFTEAGSVPALNIARWDGTEWSGLGDGLDSSVRAFAVFDDGTGPALYAVGFFTASGGSALSYIARWDGTSWSAVGGGLNEAARALAVFDDGNGPALYPAGHFTMAGGVPAEHLARWDGQSWSSVGGGLDDSVYALTVFDDGAGPGLYAAGYFLEAGGLTVNRIARWDGVSWSALGTGTSGGVLALGVLDLGADHEPILYASGFFGLVGGILAAHVAGWNGSSWFIPGNGADDVVWALAVSDEPADAGAGLFAGGTFDAIGSIAANSIARFNGSEWSTVGGGVDGYVFALAFFDDGNGPMLYAGGGFTSAGGVEASNIARWDGVSWSALGTGIVGDYVWALQVFDDGTGNGPALFVGGEFGQAGGRSAGNVARWDGTAWTPIASLGDDEVRDLAVFDDGSGPALYAGGSFFGTYAPTHSVARWDGTTWLPLPGDAAGGVLRLEVFDDGLGGGPALYVGGSFCVQSGPDESACGLARWDGMTWSDVGLAAIVYGMSVYDDGTGRGPALFVSGMFDSAGGTPARNIASWDGAQWSPLGEGLGEDGTDIEVAVAMEVFDDGLGQGPALWLGGQFATAGGLSSQNLARWGGCAAFVLGDLNGDGLVGLDDFLVLLSAWGPCPAPCSPSCVGDLDGDCVVGITDFLLLLANWS